MNVLVVGGHGQIGLRLLRLLAAGDHRARGLIRDAAQAADLEAAGAEAVVADVEQVDSIAPQVEGSDAVVFAAGAGAGSGPARKRTVDLGGALKLLDAARETGVRRYVIVSSIGAQDPAGASESMRPYLEAKADADAAVVASGLDWTIVRPGSLTDEPGTGRVAVVTDLGRRGPVPRDDVAATLLATLAGPEAPRTVGKTFELFAGETPIDDALREL